MNGEETRYDVRCAALILRALPLSMCGGLITAALMTMLVLPVLYKRFESRRRFGTGH